MDLQEKVNVNREKYKKAALLMTEFLDDILNQTPNILDSDKDMHLNLEKIKETPIEQLSKEDKVALVLVLLKQLQPYLSAQNLSTTPATAALTPIAGGQQDKMSKMHTTANTNASWVGSVTTHGHFVKAKADESFPREYGAGAAATEVDTLNNILNNINV